MNMAYVLSMIMHHLKPRKATSTILNNAKKIYMKATLNEIYGADAALQTTRYENAVLEFNNYLTNLAL